MKINVNGNEVEAYALIMKKENALEILEKQMYLNPKAGKITSSVIPGGGQMFQTYETNPDYLRNLKKYIDRRKKCIYILHQRM